MSHCWKKQYSINFPSFKTKHSCLVLSVRKHVPISSSGNGNTALAVPGSRVPQSLPSAYTEALSTAALVLWDGGKCKSAVSLTDNLLLPSPGPPASTLPQSISASCLLSHCKMPLLPTKKYGPRDREMNNYSIAVITSFQHS